MASSFDLFFCGEGNRMKGEFGKPFNFRFFRLLREILLQACLPVPFFHLPSPKKKVVKTLSFPRNKERWENLSFFAGVCPKGNRHKNGKKMPFFLRECKRRAN